MRHIRLAFYSAAHFWVDLSCALLLLGAVCPEADPVRCILLYNFSAFAVQMPIGLLADRLNRNHQVAAAGCGLVAAAWFLTKGAEAAVLAGVGNALFHVGGGLDTMNRSGEKAGPLGVFVSPGAAGLFLGAAARGAAEALALPVCGVLVAAAVLILLWCRGPENPPAALPEGRGKWLPALLCLLLVVVLPIADHKPGVNEKAEELVARLKAAGLRVKGDFSDNSPGWKFAEYEMKGVPLRLEIGPKDMEQNQCVLVRRDNREKTFVSLDELETRVPELLGQVQNALYAKAKANLDEHTVECHTVEEVKALMENGGGFAKTMWCGDEACELKMKELAGVTSRCMPFEQEHLGDTCVCCGKPAKTMIYWGVAY